MFSSVLDDSVTHGLELQKIINNLFEGINTRIQRTEIAWLTRKIIAATIVCASNETQNVKGSRTEYWRNQVTKLKKEIESKKSKQPRVSSNLELTELTVEVSKAKQAIGPYQTLGQKGYLTDKNV
jgi:hypothetical protein